MSTRRKFLRDSATSVAGLYFAGCAFAQAPAHSSAPAVRRREVMVGGRRVRTIDLHCHAHVPEAWEPVKDYEVGETLRTTLSGVRGAALNIHNVNDRLRVMDVQGIDVEAVSITAFWYGAPRDAVAELIRIQNEKLFQLVAAHPDRFVALASVALQFPYLAAEQLERAMRQQGMRGCLIGTSVNGEELSSARLRPFWAKADELGALVFIHPQNFAEGAARFRGNGNLPNVIGNPLDTTTALAHLIFDGVLDRHPGVKICAAHGGGYLPSFAARADRCFTQAPDACKPVKQPPSAYLKQIYYDSLVFTAEQLRHLVAEAGASQIVMGTDHPFGWTSESVDHILSTPSLSDADKRAILGETAAKLLRLSV
ncbi:MAG: hypothetical protein EXQ56_06455 [Acidobacteria bacterium]|nr:hypothetical protein [Acidobacteriota bacterium]